MKLDRTLAAEIRKLNGDGSRDARFETLKRVKDTKKMLSDPAVTRTFNDCVKIQGRATTAICVASTLISRKDRLELWGYYWAKEVVGLWTNRGASWLEEAVIYDGLHPSRICEYAADFIALTTAE